MAFDERANRDFERAFTKGFWRNIVNWLTRKSNDLLPFDEVREQLPLQGQRYIGLRQVPVEQIVGSMGRYRDFDRAFLPRQKRTKNRWVSIDIAHYEEISLPPIELYKMGEAYFVKDGNHRVSVARERGQNYVDAYVIEIDLPVVLTADTHLADLKLKREYAVFLERTSLSRLRPSAHIELTLPGEYERLLEHISVHRWYLGVQRKAEIPYEEAVISWYDSIYSPLIEIVQAENIMQHFPGRTAGDLYLWIIEYLWYRREAYTEEYAFEEAARQFIEDYREWPAGRLVNVLKKSSWVDYLILEHEHQGFLARTRILDYRPEAAISLTTPGFYEKMLEHIDVHRWYLGIQRGGEVPYEEAVVSWYDHVFSPLVDLIRAQGILAEFPGRTETDLYLWIIEHQGFLRETYGSEVPLEQVAEQFTEQYAPDPGKKWTRSGKKRAGGKK
jgi:hypothetical protein